MQTIMWPSEWVLSLAVSEAIDRAVDKPSGEIRDSLYNEFTEIITRLKANARISGSQSQTENGSLRRDEQDA
jgi:hypothetical protein